jgi:glycosyltransferase involved in cell wall biosynthesis
MIEKQIDVLMAVYNGEKFIRQQIESIMNQTYKNIKLWVRDNCSEDTTTTIVNELIEKYPGRIGLLLSPVNVGIIGNFGALMEHSQADYAMFSDADDVWLPEKVAYTMQKMKELEKQNPEGTPLLVHTDLKVVNADLALIDPSFWKYSNLNPRRPQTLSRQLLQNQITGCTTMINRSLLTLASPVPSTIVMHDWWLGLYAAAFGKIGVVDQPTMLYRQHGKNDTGAKRYGVITAIKTRLNPKAYQKQISATQTTYQQASVFLERHQAALSPSQIHVIKKFLKFEEATFFSKGYLMVKYGFYRVGLMRNLCMVIGSRNLSTMLQKVFRLWSR